MMKFPLKFEVQASTVSGIQTNWTATTMNHLPPITSAIPPEFSGPGGGYTPEDLFAISLLNCLIASFKVYCEKSQVSFKELKGRVILTVDKGAQGLIMSHADIYFDISGASNPEKTRKLLDDAIKNCPVSNSIKTGKTFHIEIH